MSRSPLQERGRPTLWVRVGMHSRGRVPSILAQVSSLVPHDSPLWSTGQGSITVPGCIAATSVEAPIDVEEGFPVDAPLVYYAGTVAGGENMALYQHLVERVADALERRAGTDAKVIRVLAVGSQCCRA